LLLRKSILSSVRLLPSLKWTGAALLVVGAAMAALDDAPPPTVREAQPRPEPPRSGLAAQLALSPRTPLPERALGDPFAVHRRTPAAKAAPAPAPVPTAQLLTFRYVGRLQHGPTVTSYLARDNELFAIKPGDVVDGFTIDAVTDEHIELTSIGGAKQVLPLTSAPRGAYFAPNAGPLLPEGIGIAQERH
jgi:hypothetical protein